jgi:hypothetical protein
MKIWGGVDSGDWRSRERARHAVSLRRLRPTAKNRHGRIRGEMGRSKQRPYPSKWRIVRPGDLEDWVVEDGHAFGFGQDPAADHQADQADDGGPFGAAEGAGCGLGHADYFG